MKTRILSFLAFKFLLFFFYSCQDEENPSPALVDSQTRTVNLDIHLRYPALIPFDSAYIIFKNDSSEIKCNLALDNSSHIATGHITAIPCGNWKISTSYFSS